MNIKKKRPSSKRTRRVRPPICHKEELVALWFLYCDIDKGTPLNLERVMLDIEAALAGRLVKETVAAERVSTAAVSDLAKLDW